MPTEIKICGLSSPEGVHAAVAGGADLVGFVFFPASPRNVEIAEAARLAEAARGSASVTALTVNASDELLAEIAETLRPDFIQLHGAESPERVAEIRRRTGIPVIKALGVASAADLAAAGSYLGAADRLLLDAKPPRGATRPGGNGVAFDWSILDGFAPDIPWLLSGGLAPGNVADALGATGAPGVDVSSGVETAPGRKDPVLIRDFIRRVRGAEQPAGARRAS